MVQNLGKTTDDKSILGNSFYGNAAFYAILDLAYCWVDRCPGVLGFIQQIVFDRPFGNNPAPDGLMIVIWAAFGILFPVFMYSCCMVTQVRKDGLYYRFKPFHFRMHRILFNEIRSWDAVTYHPIRDYGGWGIRFGFRGKTYNVRGNRGLQLELKNGKRILFGSQKPDEMKLAMDSAGNQ